MGKADLLLVTSRHEAAPIVSLEAAVMGVPTVGTKVGFLADWTPEAAVAVEVGDSAALARETLALLADDARRIRIANEAQRRTMAMDSDHTAARIEEISRRLVG
jgi:glycosyltransferase involved in cell wall biosynthesis